MLSDFLDSFSEKIWIFTKELYCKDLRPGDVFPLPKVKLWKRRQPWHLKNAHRCTCSDPAPARTSPLRVHASLPCAHPPHMSPTARVHHHSCIWHYAARVPLHAHAVPA